MKQPTEPTSPIPLFVIVAIADVEQRTITFVRIDAEGRSPAPPTRGYKPPKGYKVVGA